MSLTPVLSSDEDIGGVPSMQICKIHFFKIAFHPLPRFESCYFAVLSQLSVKTPCFY